ncbi:CPBP family intramembrane metalloprotease [Candidatus Peregrinibacteria bacterium]|nr:CPBP family intramembrane metalloprotease [Candidatus Peregrinibacteria bacterium]
MDTPATKWKLKDAAIVTISMILLIVGLNYALLMLNFARIFEKMTNKSLVTSGLFIVQELLFVLPLYFFVVRKYEVKARELGFKRVGWTEIAKCVFAGFAMLFAFNFLLVLISSRIPFVIPGFEPQESHVPLFGGTQLDIALAVVVLVFIAPVVEELLFRGFLLQTFLAKFKPWIASLLTATFFALVHLELESAGMIIFLALILNWMFMRTRSIWPGIVFHMFNNAVAFAVELLVWSGYLQV